MIRPLEEQDWDRVIDIVVKAGRLSTGITSIRRFSPRPGSGSREPACERISSAIAFYQKHGCRPDKEEYLEEPYLAYGARLSKML